MSAEVQCPWRRQLVKTSVASLFASAWAPSADAQKPAVATATATSIVTKGVELADLMRRLMHPKGAAGPLPWSALQDWPLAWRSSAASRLPRPQPGMSLLRMGQLVLLIDGQPAYRDNRRRPGTWALGAYGSEAGVAEISLGSQQLAADNRLSLSMLKSHGFTLEAVCQAQGAQGDNVWRLSHPGHVPLRVVESTSQGLGGIGIELRLPYTPARIQLAVCS